MSFTIPRIVSRQLEQRKLEIQKSRVLQLKARKSNTDNLKANTSKNCNSTTRIRDVGMYTTRTYENKN